MKDDILTTAKERFKLCLDVSSRNREKAKEDIRFAAASPDDPWQWDRDVVQQRKLQQRPYLTINKLPQHIRQVTNDIRQNRPSIRYRPADGKADPEVADILMGLARHIEAHSDADIAYDSAAEAQVTHGIGYIRVMADYVSEYSFDQDIFIKRVRNPLKVHLDPNIEDPAGADATFAFIEDCLSEKEFKAQYPKASPIDWTFANDAYWYPENRVRVVEYFDKTEEPATLLLWANGETSFEGDPVPKGVPPGEVPIKKRKSAKCKVTWYKLNGQEILEERVFPSRYIPIARVVGNEWEVDGQTIISGLVRNAKDSQRMYNMAQSAIVERVMQAPKAPWIVPAEGVEGYEKHWQSANTANHAYLPYNHKDQENDPIPAPNRIAPASVEPGLAQVATGASDDIKAETGQYDASLGQRSNETSGRAILARQREGDNATYHYVDNLGRAIRHVGRIILDMLPKIYDTRRVARILGEDASVDRAILDPNSPQALVEVEEAGEINRIFNPFVGLYDVYTTSGPSFTTRRIEAVEAMTAMTQANPQLWQVIGDQLVKNMDWPGAEDMAERLKTVLLPEIRQAEEQGGQVPPEVMAEMQQMQQQMQQMAQALEQADALKAQNEADKLEIERYKAETERMQALAPAIAPEQIQAVVSQTVAELLNAQVPAQEEIPPAEMPM
jgi:hypothetical protein